MPSNTLISLSVTDKVHSPYYSPILKAIYTEGKLTCTREVMQCRTSAVWFFVSDTTQCPKSLAKLLQSEYNHMITVRRSSYPPPMSME